ncbi:MAG: hypothetical protein RLZ55_1306 [Actinomycetota bacterium]
MSRATAALVLAVAVVLALWGSAGPAQGFASTADEVAKAPVQVTVAALTPTVPTPGATLVVSGTLTNVSTASLRDVGVRLRVGSAPVLSRAELIAATADPASVEGPTLAQRPGFVTLAPNASTTFELSVRLTASTLPTAGVLALQVESVDGAGAMLGAVGTSILWYPVAGTAPAPVPLTMLWPLVGSPARDADGVVLGDQAAAEFAAGGRLTTVLAAGSAAAGDLSWSIDPQTLELAGVLTAPHEVLADGQPVDAPGSPAAGSWLAQVRQTMDLPGVDASASGYADPDSTAEAASGLERDLVRATTTAAEQVEALLGRKVRDGLSWPPTGLVDDRTLGLLRGAGVSAVVLQQAAIESPAAIAPGGGLVRLGTDSGPITAIVSDDDMSASLRLLGAGSQWATLGRQNFLTLVALAAQEGQDLVVAPPVDWAPSGEALQALMAGLKSIRLTAPRSLAALLVGADTAAAGQLDPAAATKATETARAQAQQMAGVAQINQTIDAIGTITESPDPAVVPVREAALRCASAQWRNQPGLGALLLERTTAQAEALHDRVRISSQGPVAFPGAEGRVPVTVSNDLSVPVTVSVALIADQDYRLEDQPPQPVRIPAGQRLSLEVPVLVVGSEPLTVTASLLGPDGTEYGAGEVFELRTTAYTRVAGWVVGGALALLVMLVVFNVVRRIRTSRKESAGGTGAT